MPFLLRSLWAVLVTVTFPVGISRGSAWRWQPRPPGLNASSFCQRAASPWPLPPEFVPATHPLLELLKVDPPDNRFHPPSSCPRFLRALYLRREMRRPSAREPSRFRQSVRL